MRRMRIFLLSVGIGTSLWLGALHKVGAQTVVPVPQLDPKQFAGVWYELAHYPDKSEKNCVHEATVLYAPNYKPEQFSVVRSCQAKNETTEVKNLDVRPASKGSTSGALKARTIWPFYAKYSVIALAPDYTWAVVASPNHKVLSLLARKSSVSSETLAQMKQKAIEQGFDVSRLVYLPSS